MRAFELVEHPDQLREAIEAQAMPCLSEIAIRDYFACFEEIPPMAADVLKANPVLT